MTLQRFECNNKVADVQTVGRLLADSVVQNKSSYIQFAYQVERTVILLQIVTQWDWDDTLCVLSICMTFEQNRQLEKFLTLPVHSYRTECNEPASKSAVLKPHEIRVDRYGRIWSQPSYTKLCVYLNLTEVCFIKNHMILNFCFSSVCQPCCQIRQDRRTLSIVGAFHWPRPEKERKQLNCCMACKDTALWGRIHKTLLSVDL